MKRRYLCALIVILCAASLSSAQDPVVFSDGDLIFQTSKSRQSAAIQLATRSVYSHVGIVFVENGKPYVYEAADTVRLTPLAEWIERGEQKKYVVKRLKDQRLLTGGMMRRLRDAGYAYKDKKYDIYFSWSDDAIYCSELVYKMFKNGLLIDICVLERLKDFDFSHPLVKAKLKERYGEHVPYDETVVSPKAIFESERLVTIYSNY